MKTTTSRYRLETDRVATQMDRLRDELILCRCECGAVWNVAPDGHPLSMLGEWAIDWHTLLGHHQVVTKP